MSDGVVLVLRPGALGDTLLAVPALRALRRACGSVTLAAHAATARLLESLGEVDRGMSFEDASLRWIFTEEAGPEEAVVAWMAPAPGLRRARVLAPSRPPAMNRHCARYLLETLAPLGIELTWDERPLQVTPTVSDEVLVHPGSGSRAKNWPPERFAALIDRLNGPVRLVVGEADFEAADAIGQNLPRLQLPSLEELAARLAGCKAYVGNDSGVSHLAGLCGAHSVVLFGPSDPDVWRPLGPHVQVIPFDTEPSEVVSVLRYDH